MGLGVAGGCTFAPETADPDAQVTGPFDADLGAVDMGFDEDGGDGDAGFEDAGDAGGAEPTDGGIGCGNGVLEANEACDDGDRTPEDGCENNCQITPGWQCNQASPSLCERAPVLCLTGTTAREGETAVVLARLTKTSVLFPVRFRWFTQSGTAVAPADYAPVMPTDATIGVGAQTLRLEVALAADADQEMTEEFRVQFTDPIAAIAGDNDVAVSVLDDTRPTTRGLVARYYLDGSPVGASPAVVLDATGGLDLEVTTDFGQPEVVQEPGAGLGLAWSAVRNDGRAHADLDQTSMRSRLDGATAATLEAVVDVLEVEPLGTGSFIAAIEGDSLGGLSGTLIGNGRVCIGFALDVRRCWDAALVGTGRRVVTLVFDANAARVVSLYVDGVDQGDSTSGDVIPAAPALSMPDDAEFVLGNRADGNRAIRGTIGYVSIYDRALTADDIVRNAILLGRDDDG